MRGFEAKPQSWQLRQQTGGGWEREERTQSEGLDQAGGRTKESGYWNQSAGLQISKLAKLKSQKTQKIAKSVRRKIRKTQTTQKPQKIEKYEI